MAGKEAHFHAARSSDISQVPMRNLAVVSPIELSFSATITIFKERAVCVISVTVTKRDKPHT